MRAIDGDELLEHVWRERLDSRERIAKLVESRPTIIPERKRGRWEDCGVNGWKCSNCRYEVARYNNTAFCPNCGTDMRGGQK